MDVREKLVELICDGTQKTEICTTDTYMDCETCRGDCGYCTILADHLIANGVTVQEWVSVDDRLPEDWRICGLHSEKESIFQIYANGSKNREKWLGKSDN